ncbi:ATP-binding cassette domain-containing protein [Staphylococcus epidermidis]|uniref:ATP-binding cassette domain-containing protein n=1 Tax=Staphylococcus epidermidis TaxID=1282 RepID=UPI002093F164|nr:ATP-binding cassette domain-containing protein [Staphylococcus epidermidis]MCG2218418.1 ATP-binding cassette domain-containing protein [Staphylococcus epidermidis]MCO6290559.1 ATP-binding cassette domain-containing protein [Staphylococcus epidermidis]
MENIKLIGGRKHNLKNISVSLPKNQIVMATGVSGSGKSSLMFDLIFEEGKRLYLESIGLLNGLVSEINYDELKGISPTISVKQNLVKQNNPRSTIASKTEVLKILSTLFSNYGSYKDENGEIRSGYETSISPEIFSYNNPKGMCKSCYGLGKKHKVLINNLINEPDDTLHDILKKLQVGQGTYNLFKRNFYKAMDVPLNSLNDELKNDVIYGHFVKNNSEKQSICLERILDGLQKKGVNVDKYYILTKCSRCSGQRLETAGRKVQIHQKNISDLCEMSLSELYSFLIPLKKETKSIPHIQNMIDKICIKLSFLINFHLGYLSLYRDVKSLSGGEIQRLFLSEHLNSQLNSVIYVLDEPTVGLHASEKEPVIDAIKKLKEQGNSVLIVDHDKKMIQESDFIVDIGPKAGIEGGKIIHQGDYNSLLKNEHSITGQYLSGKQTVYNRKRQDIETHEKLNLSSLNNNNIKSLSISLPLNCLIAITGVSGSGKTSLLNAISSQINNIKINTNNIKDIIKVEQEPIGRSINSIPATYLNIWDDIRKQFSKKSEQFTASDFSFNSKGGCTQCKGKGQKVIEFTDGTKIFHVCSKCKGTRYKEEVLKIKIKNKNIYDILNMQISEALNFFADNNKIYKKLKIVCDIGMGYIRLGQPTSTLSGGEAQRLKLSKELNKTKKNNSIYILDEPTSGLSLYDSSQLLKILSNLIKQGNTVIIAEHNNEIIKRSDYIFELGPSRGDEGGKIINSGTPIELQKNNTSIVGKYI